MGTPALGLQEGGEVCWHLEATAAETCLHRPTCLPCIALGASPARRLGARCSPPLGRTQEPRPEVGWRAWREVGAESGPLGGCLPPPGSAGYRAWPLPGLQPE